MKLLGCLFLSLVSIVAVAKQSDKPSSDSSDLAPLKVAIDQVRAALDEYQKNRGTGSAELPPLSAAEFDFKVTTTVSSGVTFSILIFKFGNTTERSDVSDVTFTYALPPPEPKIGAESVQPPPLLKDELAKTIQGAASALKESFTFGNLPLKQVTVNIQYGVKRDVSGSGTPTISLVTVGLSGDKNKNSIQSVKLTFGK